MFSSTLFRTMVASFALVLLFSAPVLSEPKPQPKETKVHKLLILDSQKGNPYDEVRASLLKSLEGYGYFEGKNLKVTLRVIGNDIKGGERILGKEINNKYDVIFVGGTAATIAAKNALYGKAQPVVFGSPTDPVGIGVIKDFKSRPAANFTGVCYPVPVKARLKFIKQLLPRARTLGLIYADMPQSHSYNRWVEDLLKNDPAFKDIKVIFRPVALVTGEFGDKTMAEEAAKHIRELDTKVDAYIKPCDQMGTRKIFSRVVYKTSGKPLIGLVRDDVMGMWGATATMFPDHAGIGKQAARMIRDLFEGGRVKDLVPEWPKKYGFAVDLQKAKQFGIKVPVEILEMSGENIIQ